MTCYALARLRRSIGRESVGSGVRDQSLGHTNINFSAPARIILIPGTREVRASKGSLE